MNWIHKLIHYFLFAGTMFFAEGAVAIASAGGTDGTVIDNAVTEGSEPGPGTEGGEAPVDAGVDETTAGDQPAELDADAQSKIDARTLPADVRAHLAELRTAGNAAVADKIQGAFAKQANFYKEFPGGMKEAREFKTMVTELGGKEGLQTFEQEKVEWRDIDEQWLKGDPGFVDRMIEFNPDSFAKIAPHALNKFASVDPAAYDYHMSGVMMVTLRESGILNDLYLAKQLVGMNQPQEAVKLLDKIDQWTKNLDKISKTQPTPRKVEPKVDDTREQGYQQRETQLFEREVGLDVEPKCDSLMQKELKPFLKGTEMTPRNQRVFKMEVMAELRSLADKDPNFKSNFAKLHTAKDKEGIARLTMSKYEEHMASVVKKVYGELFRTTSFAGQKKVMPTNGKPAPVVQGWTKVTARPNPQDVDRSRAGTTDEMIRAGGAILKSGKKIYWGEKPPA